MDLEDEDALVEAIRRFVEKEIKPRVQAPEAQESYPDDVIARMIELGLFSIMVPEEYGGLGLDAPAYARIMEELAAGWTSLPSFINSHCSVSSILAKYGTDEQRQRFLPRLARGEIRGAIALTEPNAGSDLQAIRTTATTLPGGEMLLQGGKIFITNGARASLYVVLVKTDPAAVPAKNGMSLCILERELLKAVIVLRTGEQASEASLLEHCRSRLAAYKLPRRFSFRDSLPVSPAGKVLKRELIHE